MVTSVVVPVKMAEVIAVETLVEAESKPSDQIIHRSEESSSHAPSSFTCTITNPNSSNTSSTNKRSAFDEQESPKKKMKGVRASEILQSNNNGEGSPGKKMSITDELQSNKDNSVGAPISKSDVGDTTLQLQTADESKFVHLKDKTKNDALFGGCTNKLWDSNARLWKLVEDKKALYHQTSSRNERSSIAMGILHEWQAQDPPGRFLILEPFGWKEVGDEISRKKIVAKLGRGSRKKKRDSDESNTTTISFGDGENGDVCPHAIESGYNDVLSYFASTTFAAESQLSLHEQKESSVQRECPILQSHANLPILSQKQFMKAKSNTVAANADEVDTGNKITSPYIEKEVSKFLIEEAKNLVNDVTSAKTGQCQNQPSPPTSVMASHQAQVTNPQTAPKIAMASKEINTTNDTTSKLPVAFGFSLDDDDGTSKQLAQEATEKWQSQGMKAATSKGKKRVSIGEDVIKSGGRSLCITPKAPKTPSSTTPKTPKTPATLLETKSAPNLTEGWMIKTFQRTGGKSCGSTDKYFYSPQKEIKFRSMKGCKQFIEILGEPEVDGNETIALKLYKERGYKF